MAVRNSTAVPLADVKIRDEFWSHYIELVREVVIPYQWEALNDRIPGAEPSHAIRNFRIAAKEARGEYGGLVFQDSDLAKWLEAVGYSLQTTPNPELERIADQAIDLAAKAQQPDGYLNTYYSLREPGKRWTNLLECHELYCAGHFMEAAVAYYQGTGKSKLLDVMCRYADHIDTVFGTEPGKIRGYCGHPEIELALVKLYRETGRGKYLRLAQYFIEERGREPNYFQSEWERRGGISHWTGGRVAELNQEYQQSHRPVLEQTMAVGHAVRAVYLYSGMADIAMETGDENLLKACRTLWNSIVTRQMYITGGIGATVHGEAFTFAHDLPNDTVYQETCASIGLVFLAHRMLQIEAKSEYGDVMERALYNSILSAIAWNGKAFFYVNPLEVWPEASAKDPGKRHIKPVRQKWYGCACCPPNIARLLSALGGYIYTANTETVYVHLYIGGEAEIRVGEGKIKLTQETRYPWEGKVSFRITTETNRKFGLGLRIPGWCRTAEILINHEKFDIPGVLTNGYAILNRVWRDGDEVVAYFQMPVEFVQSSPKVRANAGKVAIQRGPLVYCLEEADNGNNLPAISLSLEKNPVVEYAEYLPGGAMAIYAGAARMDESSWDNILYRPYENRENSFKIKAVPYFLWGNREPGEMLVWIRYK